MGPANTASTRASNACEPCRKRKAKCSGERPCQSCTKHNRECSIGDIGRKKYSETYVNRLLARLKTHEQQANGQKTAPGVRGARPHSDSTEDALPSPNEGYNVQESMAQQQPPSPFMQPASQIEGFVPTPPPTRSSDRSVGAVNTVSPSAVDLASGPALETHLRSLVKQHSKPTPTRSTLASQQQLQSIISEESEHAFEWDPAAGIVEASPDAPVLPTQAESQRLLHIFQTYMGVNQHFFDPRAFTDALTMLYRSQSSRMKQQNSVWYSEYLLVLAIGRLLDDDHSPNRPPGHTYFAEAVRRLPPTYKLGQAGMPAVEALALAATYLQWIDNKHDAYLYVGQGVRLAVALGYSQPYVEQEQRSLPSEATHQTRLFWTLYMLDRRLSSILSLPVGVNNPLIKADMPRDFAGFNSAIPLCINIKIAHTTGEIMCGLYGTNLMSRADHVQKIEDLLRVLRDIAGTIPPEFSIDFDAPASKICRTGASLHLMVFQAMLLCLRPLILQAVRVKVADSTSAEQMIRGFPRLLQSCREAASRSVRVLSELKRQRLLARFGFFDLDATFSAAFILVMIALLDEPNVRALPVEIRAACDILRYMSEAGNHSAQRRLEDVAQFCAQVWSIDYQTLLTGSETALSSANDQHLAQLNGAESLLQLHQTTKVQAVPWSANEWSNGDDVSWGLDATFGLDFDFTTAADELYSSYNDAGLSLTGIDHADWSEMEKLFSIET